MATKQEIVETIQKGNQRVTRTFSVLTEEQLNTRVHFDEIGWTAKQLLAHLAGRAPVHERMVAMAGSGAGFPANFDLNGYNQQIVEERSGKSRDALLAEFLTAHDALIERVQGMSDEQLSKTLSLRGTDTATQRCAARLGRPALDSTTPPRRRRCSGSTPRARRIRTACSRPSPPSIMSRSSRTT